MNDTSLQLPILPHHKLIAYAVAKGPPRRRNGREDSRRQTPRRSHARREGRLPELRRGRGKFTRADKARAFTIARGEVVETAAAVEIAALCGGASQESVLAVARIADRLVALLTGLIRP